VFRLPRGQGGLCLRLRPFREGGSNQKESNDNIDECDDEFYFYRAGIVKKYISPMLICQI
jgi:hypothetical protein